MFLIAPCSSRASSRDAWMTERGAAPAGEGPFPSHSGGSGTPLGRHYGRSARSSLHWSAVAARRRRIQETRPGAEGATPIERDALQMPRWSAGRRTHRKMRARLPAAGFASSPQGVRFYGCAFRRSAPSRFVRASLSPRRRGGMKAHPAPLKGDSAALAKTLRGLFENRI